jgi:sialidase-1
MFRFSWTLGLLVLLTPALWSQPDTQVALNLEPTSAHPRNSEGAFFTLKSDRIVFYYSQFSGDHSDFGTAEIAEMHSDDNGRHWSSSRVAISRGENQNIMDVSLLRLGNGHLAMFYDATETAVLSRPYWRDSADEGQTWSSPRTIIASPGWFVLNNDRVIRTQRGRILVPVSYHRLRSGMSANSSFDAAPGTALWYYSDDYGATWRESETEWNMPVPSQSGMQEPGLVELADGTLFSWARTDGGAQYGFRSTDGGRTWTAPEVTELKSPVAPASIKRLPHSTALLALFNDHSGRYPCPAGRRTPLVAAISHDGGRTWPARRMIEKDPNGWYCYTAMHWVDGGLLLAYCAGDYPKHGLDRLRIRWIALPWLLEAN